MSVHARLTASSADRWLACAGSVGGPESPPTIYSASGTFAHDIAAGCLKTNARADSFVGKRQKVDGFEITCDERMASGIQVYVDAVMETMQTGDQLLIETSLKDVLKSIDPDLGGTGDAIIYRESSQELFVFDFKSGAGKYVEAVDNKQLKVYGLGAMLKVDKPVKLVHVIIVQPNYEAAEPVRRWSFKGVEIIDFIADVQEAAAASRLPDPPLVAGKHCDFCTKSRTCKELERQNHALAAQGFEPTALTSPVEIAKALAMIPLVKARIKAWEQFAYAEATRGVKIPGYKLVDKKADRQYASAGDVIEWGEANGVDVYAPRELLSPAQLEARVSNDAPRGKKAEYKRKVAHLIVPGVSSGTALVPESDARDEVKQIAADVFDALPAKS